MQSVLVSDAIQSAGWGLGSGKLCEEVLAAAKKREGLERYLNEQSKKERREST